MACLHNILTLHMELGKVILYLFIFFFQPLGNMERKDKQLTKLLLYADDTTAVLSDTCIESLYNFTFSIARQI